MVTIEQKKQYIDKLMEAKAFFNSIAEMIEEDNKDYLEAQKAIEGMKNVIINSNKAEKITEKIEEFYEIFKHFESQFVKQLKENKNL